MTVHHTRAILLKKVTKVNREDLDYKLLKKVGNVLVEQSLKGSKGYLPASTKPISNSLGISIKYYNCRTGLIN